MRGIDVVKGHRKGAQRVKDIVRYCGKKGVEYLSLFAFSTENWKRSKREVEAIMELLVEFIILELPELKYNNVKLLVSGRRRYFSQRVLRTLNKAQKQTKDNTGLTLILCLDYGGRQEIVDAVNKIKFPVKEEEFVNHLYLPDIPDIDLMIRTGGEERISNFLLWQLSYAELYFTSILWPDFTDKEMDRALKSYNIRQRRFGMRIEI